MMKKLTAGACLAFVLQSSSALADALDDANAACMANVSASVASIRPLQNLQRATEPGSTQPISAVGIGFQPGFESCPTVVVQYAQRLRDTAAQRGASAGDVK